MTVLNGCGIHIETIAQPLLYDASPAAAFDPSPAASQIFAPCVSAKSEPLQHTASAIADLLVGKDRYRTDCAPNPDTTIPLDGIIEDAPRALTPQPVVATPANPAAPGVLVTDELVGAVLTGTSEYWYQPVIGPA
ncbi:hypothetical protein C6A86_019545 [Mycobacterium sp. ITM-2016-00316]|uniref:hypothetical protein n=1 Tax=Mycobacterium sp. ITM-2016-00316 TaxID=2099695 RepID=UPI001157277E|nr:hypothetical protein [Mycobacterium sp. ITM-2016-00316]WNG80412.1 hypothetical protein C6A86_019545 [Mycobacterium sp. ITM-2016-00316]